MTTAFVEECECESGELGECGEYVDVEYVTSGVSESHGSEVRLGQQVFGQVAAASGETPVELVSIHCIHLRG